ncbi:uncharacterized protein CBL_11286 [Carabus blaptoides fortunei]
MIDLTIKTLDSQNHAFSVDDDITVAQFKERIAEVINIPVDSQRLIYCGRVLQDSKKLQEYDVNGKVVHLVQRAPPSATRRARSPQPTGPSMRRPFGGFNGSANAMYLGSMAFPSGLMEAQGIVPPPPTQSLSGSRLNVARRMIRRAENILNHLEDPQGTRTRESPPEETQDEVTPVFAAQVFVPHSHSEDPLASISAAVSAVENDILQGEQQSSAAGTDTPAVARPVRRATRPTAAAEGEAATSTPAPAEETPPAENGDSTATPSATAATAGSSSSATAATEGGNNGNQSNGRLPENSSGTIEMARLLDDLNKIHERLRPFMDRYHSFMREDPTPNSENVQDTRQTQAIINRVSEIMHLLGHAYHSLSDVMVQVSTPPPRPLLCRPILIQHSAVVQAGIPIQVEAQINLAPDRRPTEANATPQSTPATGEQTGTTPEGTTTSTTTPTAPHPTITTAQIRPGVHEIRIDSFPLEFRGFPRQPMFNITTEDLPPPYATPPPYGTQAQRPQPTAQPPSSDTPTEPTAPPTSGAETTGTPNPRPSGDPEVLVVPPSFMNNPNMEFFMEVTPESITIDSLETTVVTSGAQADNVLRGTFGSAPPEFIQSILQAVAGQMMSGATPATTQQQPSQPTSTATTAESTETSQSGGTQATAASAAAANGTNVNSQARGNTQTHPTTSTQTRSTSRPHVHLAQHTMQGFDPFLPCNSHHIRHRRRIVPTATATTAAATPSTEGTGDQQNNNQTPNPLYNVLQGLLRSLSTSGRQQRQETGTNTSTAPSAPPAVDDPLPPFSTLLGPNMDFADLSQIIFDERNSAQGTTLATFLQNFPDHQYTEGESLFTDLVMTLARGLTFGDVVSLNTGRIDSLVRIRPALRTFFRNRVLEGECPTQAAIDRGATRLITELRPILELMNTMRIRDNIDVVQSATQLCRSRFPNIITQVMSRTTGSLRSLVDQCLLTIRQLCALALHSCTDGQEGVEEVFRTLIARYTVGVSPDIHNWTVTTSLAQLRHFLRTLDVPHASIQQFIVRTPAAGQATATETTVTSESEPMDYEEVPLVRPPEDSTPIPSPVAAEPLIDTEEPLPNVVIGSEPWHRGLSAEWIPIITRDTQRQRRQNPQAPFSDAYLSGLPSKRRKIVAAAKPQGNLSQVISDGVRRAVTTTGLAGAVPLDVVAQAASADLTLQSAYRDLRTLSECSKLFQCKVSSIFAYRSHKK